jgi:hypothetical protein
MGGSDRNLAGEWQAIPLDLCTRAHGWLMVDEMLW